MPRTDSVCYECAPAARGAGRLDPQRILQQGLRPLSDLELIAIVLGETLPEGKRLALAGRLLDGGSAALLRRLSPRRIRRHLGDGGSLRLLAALELGRRAIRGAGLRSISSPRHVLEYARTYATAQKEHFLGIHLNARHVPVSLEVVSIGTLSSSLVHPREVFRTAIGEGSASLILVHNHPSGDPSPSPDDIEITSRLCKVGELVGIEVLDHVILAQERYFSFREEGFLGKAE
jgi:DNA repair protein RadC